MTRKSSRSLMIAALLVLVTMASSVNASNGKSISGRVTTIATDSIQIKTGDTSVRIELSDHTQYTRTASFWIGPRMMPGLQTTRVAPKTLRVGHRVSVVVDGENRSVARIVRILG